MRLKNLEGSRFGRLVVLEEARAKITPGGQVKRRMLCRCDCGNEKVVAVTSLRSGNTQSCGCYHAERIARHGLHGTRTYRIWAGMIRRGTGKNTQHNYGDRGIDVCDSWKDFGNFVKDMGECPPHLTLERLDNDLGYTPENCAWVTFKEQQRNKRTNRHIEFNGEKMCLIEASEKYGINYKTLSQRLDSGWPIEDALLKTTEVARFDIAGRCLSVAEISKEFGIPCSVIRHRLKAGWPVHKVISQPTRPYREVK